MGKLHVIAYIYLLTLIVIWLTSNIVHYVWRNRPPPLMVYESDVNRYANSNTTKSRIPRVIHQIMAYTKTWAHQVPATWNASYQSVLAKNVGEFKHHLWTDEEMHIFIQKHEPEFYKNTYVTYKYDMQRVDSFRYVLLYHFGGIYIDMDNGCNRPFKDLIATLEALDPNSSHLAAFPRSDAFGVETDFLIATPGHPFYKQLISRLHLFNHHFLFHFWTILVSAGPIYVSIQDRLYSSLPQREPIRILDYNVFQPMFIWKSKGHTWIAEDASFLFYISAKGDYILFYCKIFTITLIIFLLVRWYRLKKDNNYRLYLPLNEMSLPKIFVDMKKFLFFKKIDQHLT